MPAIVQIVYKAILSIMSHGHQSATPNMDQNVKVYTFNKTIVKTDNWVEDGVRKTDNSNHAKN